MALDIQLRDEPPRFVPKTDPPSSGSPSETLEEMEAEEEAEKEKDLRRRWEEGEDAVSSRTHSCEGGGCWCVLFCSSPGGATVCLHVLGFRPSLVYRLRSESDVGRLLDELRVSLNVDASAVATRGGVQRLRQSWGFEPHPTKLEAKQFAVVRVYFASLRLFHRAKRIRVRNADLPLPMEDKIDPEAMFWDETGIGPSTWLVLDGAATPLRDASSCMDVEFKVHAKQIRPFQRGDIAPLLIASYDIECASPEGSFPESVDPTNYVSHISTTFYWSDQKEGSTTVVQWVQRDGGAPPHVGEDASASGEVFRTESELLRGWRDLIVDTNPSIVLTWNGFGFDNQYLFERAESRCPDFSFTSRLLLMKGDLFLKDLSSKGGGDNMLCLLPLAGRVQIDLFKYSQQNVRTENGRQDLNTVAAERLGENKVHLGATTEGERESGALKDDYQEMFRLISLGDPKSLARVAAYNRRDSELLEKLERNLKAIQNLVQMSRVTNTSLHQLNTRGQMIKAYNQVAKEAHKFGMFLNHPPPFPEGKIVGATVISPETGFHRNVGVLDFASLYPSIMREHNLCPSTLVRDPSNVPYLRQRGFNVVKFQVSEKVSHHFVANVPGLLPRILDELVASRAAVRKEMKRLSSSSTEYGLLDGRQLAIKVSANSVYGFCGSKVSVMGCKEVAETVCAVGRDSISLAKQLSEKHVPGAKVIYGDSVAGSTPLLLRHTQTASPFVMTAACLASLCSGRMRQVREGCTANGVAKESVDVSGIEAWTSRGWQPVRRVLRHAVDEPLLAVRTGGSGCVTTTQDHSLLRYDGLKLTPKEARTQLCEGAPPSLLVAWPDKGEWFPPGGRGEEERSGRETEGSERKAWAVGVLCATGEVKPDMRYVLHLRRGVPTRSLRERVSGLLGPCSLTSTPSRPEWVRLSGRAETAAQKRLIGTSVDALGGVRVHPAVLLGSERTRRAFLEGAKEGSAARPGGEERGVFFATNRTCCLGMYAVLRSFGLSARVLGPLHLCCAEFERPGEELGAEGGEGRSEEREGDEEEEWSRVVEVEEAQAAETGRTAWKEVLEGGEGGRHFQYVYDLETTAGQFHAGVGELIVKNTDSVMVKMPERMGTKEAAGVLMHLETVITDAFGAMIVMEFEKLYDPYLLVSKKHYVGHKLEPHEEDGEEGRRVTLKSKGIDAKGVMVVRRDNAPWAKEAYKSAIDALMYDASPEKCVQNLNEEMGRIVRDELPLEKFVLTKQMKRKSSYSTRGLIWRCVGSEAPTRGTEIVCRPPDPRARGKGTLVGGKVTTLVSELARKKVFTAKEVEALLKNCSQKTSEGEEQVKLTFGHFVRVAGKVWVPDDVPTQPHLRLAMKMEERKLCPPRPGERTEFYISLGLSDKVAERAEDPDYGRRNGIPHDRGYYLEHQVREPVIHDLLKVFMPLAEAERIFDGASRAIKMQSSPYLASLMCKATGNQNIVAFMTRGKSAAPRADAPDQEARVVEVVEGEKAKKVAKNEEAEQQGGVPKEEEGREQTTVTRSADGNEEGSSGSEPSAQDAAATHSSGAPDKTTSFMAMFKPYDGKGPKHKRQKK